MKKILIIFSLVLIIVGVTAWTVSRRPATTPIPTVTPTPRLSVMVVNATTVPKSVHAVPWSVPQMTFPEESVSKASVQEGTVVICNPPVWTWSPPRIVEEAVTPDVPFTMRVEVAKRMPAVEVPEVKMLPWIDNVCAGEVVPMPRVP